MKKSDTGLRLNALFTGITLILLAGCASDHKVNQNHRLSDWPALKIVTDTDRGTNIEARVETLLAKMTLEEKVGQILQPEITNVTPQDVRKYHLGSVLNGGNGRPNKNMHASVKDWINLADSYYLASVDKTDGGVGIPIIWGIDAVHGNSGIFGATILPHNIGLGAANDPELMVKLGDITARETAAIGLDWIFAPTVAVARDDRWGRTYESFSEFPERVARLAAPYIIGIQGDNRSKESFFAPGKVIATSKHFLGDGGTTNGRDQGNTEVSLEALVNIHGPGYFSTLEAGSQTVMASYSSWNGVRMHGNKELLTGALKDKMGFDGFVIGDFNGHAMIPGCSNGNCPQALLAGLDMYMVPKDWKELYRNLIAQVKDRTIPVQRLNNAVRRILTVKMRAGLFDRPRPSQRKFAGKPEFIGASKHRALARRAVRESLVLLKNNHKTLPINPASHILVAGPYGNNIAAQSGGWTLNWQGTGLKNKDFPGATSIYKGLKQQVKKAGGRIEFSKKGKFETKPDVAIVVFGESPYAEYQGDLETLKFRGAGDSYKILKDLQANGIPTISVFLSGRPLWTTKFINASDAFVAAWLPGTEGGGIADVLLASSDGNPQYDFKGRLSFSWPKFANQYNLNIGDKDYDPLFAYDYGLSYRDNKEIANLSERDRLSESERLFGRPGTVFTAGRPVAPWRMYIGDSRDGRIKTEGARYISSVNKAVFLESVDRYRQEDSKKISFVGKEMANAFILGYRNADFSRDAQKGHAIVIEYKIIKKPTASVSYTLGCGGTCAENINITRTFAKAPLGEWTKSSIPLACFKDVKFDRLNSPFGLRTNGKLELELYSVKISKAEGNVLRCK